MKQNNIKTTVIIVCLLGITACLILLIPQIRQIIINITEQLIIGRALNDPANGHIYLFRISINGIIFLGLFLFCFLFVDYKKYFIYMNNEIQKIFRKNIVIAIICMFGLYLFAISSIIRADFLYIDDLGRTIDGYRGWSGFSRYTSDFLAIFIHPDVRINDISPLPQIIAALFIAIASVLMVYILSDGKVTKTACFLSLPIGLSPYFLECFSYKFDAPYMALSILVSIVPFLFIQNFIIFFISSIISLLIMCTTYQASSGIYIIIVIILCFKTWNEQKKPSREIFRFSVISTSSYCVSMIFFRLFIMHSFDDYVSTGIYPIHRLFHGIVFNFISYMRLVNADFGLIWKFLLFILCFTFIITSVLLTKRNKIIVLFVSLTTIIVMCLMSFGVYLALEKTAFSPRAMYGFGVFIACITVYLSNIHKKIVLVPAIILCWCFFAFSFTYGNALSEQKRYNIFRTEILLHDLSTLFPDKTEEPLLVKLKNSEGFSPSIKNISKWNPVIRRIVPIHLVEGWDWGHFFLTRYYNFNLQPDKNIEEDGLSKIFDSYYHTIKSDGRKVLIIIK
jgi:hypothetical protein